MSPSIVGSPAHAPAISNAVSLHAAACNGLQRALRELRNDHTDYHHAAIQARAALDAIRTLGLIAEFEGVTV